MDRPRFRLSAPIDPDRHHPTHQSFFELEKSHIYLQRSNERDHHPNGDVLLSGLSYDPLFAHIYACIQHWTTSSDSIRHRLGKQNPEDLYRKPIEWKVRQRGAGHTTQTKQTFEA